MEPETVVVLVTAPSAEEADRMATVLVEDGLAACVNIAASVSSIYRWQGELVREQETLMFCKTRREGLEERFIPAVRELHPYENPEIIALPILAGLPQYLQWVLTETRQP